MLKIVDVGISNTGSVVGALERLGCKPTVATKPSELDGTTAVVLPGVGAFKDGIETLREKRFVDPLVRLARSNVPFLGICLGMQLMASVSEENGQHDGLDLIAGRVTRLPGDEKEYRVPNIGWCEINPNGSPVLFSQADHQRAYYFVHSYYFRPSDSSRVAATMEFNGESIPVAVEHENLFGVQFHPEKSQDAGLELLHSFLVRAGHA